jgi:hypothetical protein
MRSRQLLFLLVLLVLTGAAYLVLASGRPNGKTKGAAAQSGLPSIQYIRCSHLQAHVCDALKVLGNRLQVPGKERLTITGSLTRTLPGGVTDVVPIRLITEYPHLMRLEEQRLGQLRVIAFDGQQAWTNLGLLTRTDLDLIQSIVFDYSDHFFVSQMQGAATRFLGKGFRASAAPNPNYTGPFHDIYEVQDRTTMGGRSTVQPKLVFLNTNTLRLEEVRYRISRATLPVTVQLSTPTWHTVNDQLVPDTIERRENGSSVWKLTGSSWTVSPRLDDGTFTRPSLSTGLCGNPCY